MHTPKGVNISRLVTDAGRIKERVDAVIVPDMDNGIMRMSALAGGVLMGRQGIEPVLHVYCRDKNRMALQGDLLAAHVLGVHNLLVVRGQDMDQGDHRDAMSVDDLDEQELMGAISSLEKGKDLAGFELDGIPSFFTGWAVSPFDSQEAMEAELETAAAMKAAGCRFIVAPPVFNLEMYAEFLSGAKAVGLPVIVTVFLLKSVAIARYIANSEPGAHITEDLIRRIRKSPDRENEGTKIAGETIAALKKSADGVLIQTLGWEHKIPAILDAAGL